MRKDDAQQLLDNPVFNSVFEILRERYIEKIVQDPINDVGSPLKLSLLEELREEVNSYIFDGKLEEHNKEEIKRYQ